MNSNSEQSAAQVAALTAVPPDTNTASGAADLSLQKRVIFDAIRSAYDLGYSDARNARSTPGDSAPGYKGRQVEADHGGALSARIAALASAPASSREYAELPKNRCVINTYMLSEDDARAFADATHALRTGGKPLTHEQAKDLVSKYGNDPLHLVFQVEVWHGIAEQQGEKP